VRTPTSKDAAFRWWREALDGVAPPPINEVPQAGFYRRRMVKGGPWVPVAIWIEAHVCPETGELLQPEIIRCAVDGKVADPVEQWGYVCANPIRETDYKLMVNRVKHEMREGSHAPYKPINLLTVDPPSFKQEKEK
jgi:hypothetical protein